MKKLLFLIPFLFIQNLFSLTVSDITNQVRRNIRDTDLTNPRYSNAVILDYINEGQIEINNQILLSNNVTTYVLTNGTSYYTVPSDFMYTNDVYFKRNTGETVKIYRVDQDKLYQGNPDWERSRGEPNKYWISDSTYSVNTSTALKRVSYIPVPSNLSTGTITMWYFTIMNPLTSQSDIPFNGQSELIPYHFAIVYYVTMRIKMVDGIMDEAGAYQVLYRESTNRLSTMIGNMKMPKPPQSNVQLPQPPNQ